LQREEDAERRYNEQIQTRRFDLQMGEAKRATSVAWIGAIAAIAAAILGLLTVVAQLAHW